VENRLMPAQIVIIADVWAREDKVDRLIELLRGDVEFTHAQEPHVGKFALHRDTEDPLHFVMIEAFPDESALEAHRQTDFYRKLMAEIPDLITERRRTVLAPLGFGEPQRGYLA
jgi:(4S)-4-hydroxy-5-phosphonooxypentane-2,3-dione isomerase